MRLSRGWLGWRVGVRVNADGFFARVAQALQRACSGCSSMYQEPEARSQNRRAAAAQKELEAAGSFKIQDSKFKLERAAVTDTPPQHAQESASQPVASQIHVFVINR
jgi:hypothetical protein